MKTVLGKDVVEDEVVHGVVVVINNQCHPKNMKSLKHRYESISVILRVNLVIAPIISIYIVILKVIFPYFVLEFPAG